MTHPLLFIGDSLIAYQDWQQVFPDLACINLGVPGETVDELVASLPSITERYPGAEAIIIMIGTNNLVMSDFTLLSSYQELLDILQDHYPETNVYVTSLLPLRLSWLAPDTAARLNKALQGLTDNAACHYVDLHTPFMTAGAAAFLEDGVHLSEVGYGLWCDVLKPLLNKL